MVAFLSVYETEGYWFESSGVYLEKRRVLRTQKRHRQCTGCTVHPRVHPFLSQRVYDASRRPEHNG